MDTNDPTQLIFNRIRSIDLENSSKIMGYILLQDPPEREIIRLALGPESLLHALVLKARTDLGLSSNTLSASVPSPRSALNSIPRPITRPPPVQNPFSQSSPRIVRNGLEFAKVPPWSPNGSPNSSPFLSFESTRSGSGLAPPVSLPRNGGESGEGGNGGDLLDDDQLNGYFSFLDENLGKSEELVDPRSQFGGYPGNNGDIHSHRRSFSASEVRLGSEEGCIGGGFKPCLYYARGHCKNGETCKFVHGGFADNLDLNGQISGSPSKMELFYHHQEEMLRMKAAYQQRLAAAQFMGGASSPSYDKSLGLFLQQQNDPQRAAALMLGEEMYKYGQLERSDLFALGLAERANSASRQIYLTFPADSTFKDEDVSNYFCTFGPVHDVRIPYQQKRMFGFVTFVSAETVKLILARGNPHFICDSRVLVKPYKEKGKVPDKRQCLQQQLEMGNYSPSSSPSSLDSREMYELHLGANMLSPQEMMLRRKYKEHAELQRAIEFQRRRITTLQLPEFRGDYMHHHHRSLSMGSPANLPPRLANQNDYYSLDSISQEIREEMRQATDGPTSGDGISNFTTQEELQQGLNSVTIQDNGDNEKKGNCTSEEFHGLERNPESNIDQALPDSLFASPMKNLVVQTSNLSPPEEAYENIQVTAASSSSATNPVLSTSSTGGVAAAQ